MSLLPGLSPNDHDATVAHPDHDHPVGSSVPSRGRPGSWSVEARNDAATFVIVSAQVRDTVTLLSQFNHAETTMAALPAGIVTFLFTDIEGSTHLVGPTFYSAGSGNRPRVQLGR
jgi:hypothetical protein